MQERYIMPDAMDLVTADELERWPEEDGKTELVDGRIIRMSPVGYRHGRVVARFIELLGSYVRSRDLGVVFPEVGFILRRKPDTVRAPDVAFIRKERIPPVEPRGFWNGPPDLAIEVLSPDDRPGEMRRKIDDYLTSGVALVLVADPDTRSVRVHRAAAPPIRLDPGDALDLGDAVPGFACDVRDLFE